MSHYSSSFNPFGASKAILVEKMIGTAYDVVKYVACHMKVLTYLAENLDYVKEALNNVRKEWTVEVPLVLTDGEMLIPVPEHVFLHRVTDFSCVIKTLFEDLYTPESGEFTIKVVNNALHISMAPTSPAAADGSTVIWTLIHKDA